MTLRAGQTPPVPPAFWMKRRKMKSGRKDLGSGRWAAPGEAWRQWVGGMHVLLRVQDPAVGASSSRRVPMPLRESGERSGAGPIPPGTGGHPASTTPDHGDGAAPTFQQTPPSTHGCSLQSRTAGWRPTECQHWPPGSTRSGKQPGHQDAGKSPGTLSPIPLGKDHGGINPCRCPPRSGTYTGDGDTSCSRIKKGEQRSSVSRQRRGCAGEGGSQKAGNAAKKVGHNGVGNENFALGFPRTHPMGKMGRGE